MRAIQQVRSTLKSHPLAATAMVALVALASSAAAVVLVIVAIGCFVAPKLLERHAPEIAVADAVQAVRQHGLAIVQRASVVKADEIGLRRALDAELLAASLWGSRATKATLRGDDEAALECIAQRQAHDEAARTIRAEIEKQSAAVAGLLPQVEKAKRQTAKAERSGFFLAVRKRRADARKATAFDAAGLSESADAFTRMTADIERAEDEAQAAEEILRTPAASVAERFESEERRESLDAELAELKRKVGMSRPALGARVG